jgi:hypothetical protein
VKIHDHGNVANVRWWHGYEITCPGCGLKATMEDRDCFLHGWKEHDAKFASFCCPTCYTINTVIRKEPHE